MDFVEGLRSFERRFRFGLRGAHNRRRHLDTQTSNGWKPLRDLSTSQLRLMLRKELARMSFAAEEVAPLAA